MRLDGSRELDYRVAGLCLPDDGLDRLTHADNTSNVTQRQYPAMAVGHSFCLARRGSLLRGVLHGNGHSRPVRDVHLARLAMA